MEKDWALLMQGKVRLSVPIQEEAVEEQRADGKWMDTGSGRGLVS